MDSSDGKFKTEALLTAFSPDRITLKKKDGSKVELTKARLSKADQDYTLKVTEQVKEAIRQQTQHVKASLKHPAISEYRNAKAQRKCLEVLHFTRYRNILPLRR